MAFRIGKFITDYMQLGYVQPLKYSVFRSKWLTPDRDLPVEWWYLGSDKYYHYLSELWGEHRVAWKIDRKDLPLESIDHFKSKGGADRKAGVLLTTEIVGELGP